MKNRISGAASLSLSIVAVTLATLSFQDSGSRSSQPSHSSLDRESKSDPRVTRLEKDLEELKSRYEALAADRRVAAAERKLAAARIGTSETDGSRVATADVDLALTAVRDRLDKLESAENIHLLAQAGRERVAERRLLDAFESFRGLESSPETRIEALETLRGMGKSRSGEVAALLEEHEMTEADLAWPMIEIARDTSVDPELRGDALRNLRGMKAEAIRQPLLEIFASDESPEVHIGAYDALEWQISDPAVRQVIRAAASDERYPNVQARATRIRPKLDWFDQRDATRATAESAAGGTTPSREQK